MRLTTRRSVLGLVGPVALVAVIAYVVVSHGSEIGHAADRVSGPTLILVTLLASLTLVVRSEAAVACLTAMGDRPGRLDIHPASAAAYVVSMLNHYLASPVRGLVLRRLDRRAPSIPQMVMVDTSTYLIEGCLAAILLVASASTLHLAWWMPALAVLGAAVAVVVALGARSRFRHYRIFAGLEMLAHSRQRLIVVGLAMVIFAAQIARTLIVLRATGLHPSLLQATATFVAGGVLSALLVGPAAGTAGAPLIIFGHRSLAAATAAGLILSITALLGAILYALACGPVAVRRLRRRGGQPQPGVVPPPSPGV